MSRENAESFKGFIDAFNRRDAEAMVKVVDSAGKESGAEFETPSVP